MKVLVVDDSALMRRILRGFLCGEQDIEVETARDGRDALEQIERLQPDVVTLDINMPLMDGLSCLAQIMRDSPRPVVMVSSLTEHGALATLEALELGAVDYVAKPGGTVSLNLDAVRADIVAAVRRAASARIRRSSGLTARLRHQREVGLRTETERAAAPAPANPSGAGAAGGRSASARSSRVEAVLIGASTGGPAVLTEIVAGLPRNMPVPVLIAQHIPASFTGALASRLDAACAVTVREVVATMPLEPGTVYVGRGDADVTVVRRGGRLAARMVPAGSQYRWHPSVDRLVHSALQIASAERLIGVLLTGMGDDGAEQMAALRAAGGRTIAESADSAVVWGMPGELVARNGATAVLPSAHVTRQVLNWL